MRVFKPRNPRGQIRRILTRIAASLDDLHRKADHVIELLRDMRRLPDDSCIRDQPESAEPDEEE